MRESGANVGWRIREGIKGPCAQRDRKGGESEGRRQERWREERKEG